MLSTKKEIRSSVAFSTRETQINDRIDEFINLTIDEIQNPTWAFEKTTLKGYHHLWRANRRKHTLTTVADYTTGTCDAILAAATVITFTGSTFQTDGIVAGRKIKIHDDTDYRTILSVDSEIQLTLVATEAYGGSADATGGLSYVIQGYEDYQLPRDVDEIGFFRQTTSPVKLTYVPDRLFYKWIPDPTAQGDPRFYRLWEEYGVEIQIASAEKITVTGEAGDTAAVVVIGTDANGYELIERFTLSGIAAQIGTETFTTIRQVSKSGDTGNVTIVGQSSSTTFLTLLPEDRSPRFKRVSFYPIPSSAISIYLEYYTQFRHLENDSDVPDFDNKWHWVVRTGALAKVFQYKNDDANTKLSQDNFAAGVRSMVKADISNVDFVPHLKDTTLRRRVGIIEVADDSFAPYF